MTPPDHPDLAPDTDLPSDPVDAAGAPPVDEAPPPAGKMKQRLVPVPPEMDEAQGRRAFFFLAVLAVVTALVMGAVLALNVVADPYASVGTNLFPTVTTSDRTVKADKIEELKRPPQLVILGSSRSMRYSPRYVAKKTGLRTFNAGVNGVGGISDAWAMTQFIHDRFPDAHPDYLWLVDVESFVPFEIGSKTAGEPRLARYVDQASASKGGMQLVEAVWQNRSTMLSLSTARDALRVLTNPKKAAAGETKYRRTIVDLGEMVDRPWTASEWKRRWPQSVRRYTELYTSIYGQLDPKTSAYFEKTLAFMNAQGAKPLIVLTPINPPMRELLVPLGWDERHRQVVDYIEGLQKKYDFVFLDNTDPTKFGFDPKQWYDGVHMTPVNTRRAIDYILQQTGGVPPVGTPAGEE